ncbi:MAG: AbrB/MazE/SpoVT family DNA-binding domain-containing protein [Methanothrix soehngenii]|jgi:antitoxin component of MazEF toxin-antitoxin module
MADGLLLASAWALVLDLGNLFLEAKHINRIVVRSMEVLVKKGGIIELPNSVMVELGLSEGKKVFLNVKDGEILIKPAKDIAKRLAGSIALDDVDLIDEIVESEDWL